MLNNQNFKIDELLNNDDFILWIKSNEKNSNDNWQEYKKQLNAEGKANFEKAISILKKVFALHIDDTNLSAEFIQEQYIRLLEKSKKEKIAKKSKYVVFRNVLKYAAIFILLFTLGNVVVNKLSKKSFDKYLATSDFNSSEILIKTPSNKFYKIKDDTNSKWLMENGILVNVNSDEISFVSTDNVSKARAVDYTIYVPKSKNYHVSMIDGTEVELNSDSEFTFNNSTLSKERKVNLNGEAFFSVAHNKERPFLVNSSDLEIKVLGTEFNVSNYKENNFTSTTLVEGSIQVSNPQGESKIIEPGNQAKLYHNQNKIIVENTDVQNVVAWTSGVFIFRNEKLEKLIPRLNRWFNKEFEFEGEELLDFKFTGTLKKENDLNHFLQMLKYTKGISYSIEGKKVKLTKDLEK
ncbi:FecR family protein [Polaribacter sp. Asnod6-C07]|uniref:FecR family protein n=1 Tax=Polaribacter sp. Asnod6-C07 TaxID=3160582 RepID=UPI00386AD654